MSKKNKYSVRVEVQYVTTRYYDVEVEAEDEYDIEEEVKDNFCDYIPDTDDFADEEFQSSDVEGVEVLDILVDAETLTRTAKIELLKAKLKLLEDGEDVDLEDLPGELEDQLD